MKSRRLFAQLLPSYASVIVAALIIGFALSIWRTRDIQRERAASSLEAQALLARGILRRQDKDLDAQTLHALFVELSAESSTEFAFFGHEGGMFASSTDVAETGRPPEVVAAASRKRGVAYRNREGTRAVWVYVAVPVSDPAGHLGVIRAGAPLSGFASTRDIGLVSVLGAVGLLALVAVAAARVSSREIGQSMNQISAGVERMTRGTVAERVPTPEPAELGRLGESLNEMTAVWSERLQRALQQRNEQDAVLASMIEGVLAVDSDSNVITINQAAAKLLGTDAATAPGQDLGEIVRNSALASFVGSALVSTAPLEQEITLHHQGRAQIIQVRGARLRDSDGVGIGAVIVLNEVTELRRLEQVRRDFVSNVSHELKTPVTSIKGFVETLLDGAIDDPAESRRFLEIVARQAERLNFIIEDLLMLSRLEQADKAADEMLEVMPLLGPLREAVELCAPAAAARGIRIELTCEPEIKARINPNLIQQGVVNLIDNAAKYSGDNTVVSVEAIETGDEVLIFVRDQGCGIASDHLPRLFERFYRVDRARSREMGGTGLGLSIVRHIVQSHHGRVTVESTLGIGSSFCIHLPKPLAASA